jgi:hypothetical protein
MFCFLGDHPCLGTRTGPNLEYEWMTYKQVHVYTDNESRLVYQSAHSIVWKCFKFEVEPLESRYSAGDKEYSQAKGLPSTLLVFTCRGVDSRGVDCKP